MPAAADPPLPSPTPSRPGHRSTALGYLSEPGSSAMAVIAGSSAAVRSLADLHQEMRDTTALLETGLDTFSARLHDSIPVELQQQARDLLALARSYLAVAQAIVDKAQAQLDTTSHLLSSAVRDMATKATRFTPPGALPTSDEYAAGLPAQAYGVLERAKNIIDNLLALAPADRNSPVQEEMVEDFLRGSRLSLDKTLEKIMLWHNHGKDLVIGEKEKSDKRSEDLQHRLLDLQLELSGLKRNLKDARDDAEVWRLTAEERAEQYQEKLCGLERELKEAKGDAKEWKLRAEEREKELSFISDNVMKTQLDLADQKEAAARAALESAERARSRASKVALGSLRH